MPRRPKANWNLATHMSIEPSNDRQVKRLSLDGKSGGYGFAAGAGTTVAFPSARQRRRSWETRLRCTVARPSGHQLASLG